MDNMAIEYSDQQDTMGKSPEYKRRDGRPDGCFLALVCRRRAPRRDGVGMLPRLGLPVLLSGVRPALRRESAARVPGLTNFIVYAGGVSSKAVLDNATGAGRRTGKAVTEAESFAREKANYGFEVTYRDPCTGHERGNIDRRGRLVGMFFQRRCFVPALVLGRADMAQPGVLPNRFVVELCFCQRPQSPKIGLPETVSHSFARAYNRFVRFRSFGADLG